MRRLNYLSVLLFTAVLTGFVSCNKDDDPPTSSFDGTVNGTLADDLTSKIKTVKAYYSTEVGAADVAEATVSNGKFTIKLPEPAASDFEEVKIAEMLGDFNGFDASKMPKITATPEKANVVGLSLKGFDNDNDSYSLQLGKSFNIDDMLEQMIHGSMPSLKTTIVVFAYVDRDVTMTGSGTYKDNFEGMSANYSVDIQCHYKKGWNTAIFEMDFTIDGSFSDATSMKANVKVSVKTAKPASDLKWGEADSSFGS